MTNLMKDLDKAFEIFNINTNVTINKEDVMTVQDMEMTQMILDNCDAIEESMSVRNEINMTIDGFWNNQKETLKQFNEEWNQIFNKEDDEESADDFITDMDALVEEAEKLHTAELLRIEQEEKLECERNAKVLNSILDNPGLIAKYGNKTISRQREIAPLLNKVPTGCDKSLIQITIDTHRCTYNQALSKLAQKFNINYDHETWFKGQLEILEHNKKLINNPAEIVIKYPQLWNKMKQDAHMRKYYMFLLDLFQTQLEHNGLSYRGKIRPLIASASCGFIAKALRVRYETAKNNMNNLTMFGATRKLTDKQVKKYDKSRYENIMDLAGKAHRTITTFELILWDDEVLKAMNDMIIEKQRTRATNKGQCHAMLDSIGYGDVMNKNPKELTDEEKLIIADLKKWGRKKAIDSTGCGFITMDDLHSRLTTLSKKHNIYIGQKKRNVYISIAMTSLGLSYEYVSNELKTLINSKKLNKLNHGKVWIHIGKANQLNKYN